VNYTHSQRRTLYTIHFLPLQHRLSSAAGVSAHDDVGRRGERKKKWHIGRRRRRSHRATDEIPAAFGTTRIPQRTRTVLVAYMKFHQHARVVLTLILHYVCVCVCVRINTRASVVKPVLRAVVFLAAASGAPNTRRIVDDRHRRYFHIYLVDSS